MKKFMLIYHGDDTSTPEVVVAWNNWFQRRAASFADVGHAFSYQQTGQRMKKFVNRSRLKLVVQKNREEV